MAINNQEKAEKIAALVMGPGSSNNWQLKEFDGGWVVQQEVPPNNIGAATIVIEKEGKVMQFPSSVPPQRIIENYSDVVDRGFPVDIDQS